MNEEAQTMGTPHFTLEVCKEVLHNVFQQPLQKTLFAGIVCTASYIFNGGEAFLPVFSLVLLDAVTGIMKAIHKDDFKGSRAVYRSAQKFFVYLILISTSRILDTEFPGDYATNTMKTFLMVTEAVSIMENIHAMGWPVPMKLVQYLKLQSDPKKKDETKT